MSEIHVYAGVVAFISLIIILAVAFLLVEQEKEMFKAQNASINYSVGQASLVIKIKCVNCMQYENAERDACYANCIKGLNKQ